MNTLINTSSADRLEKVWQALQAAQKLQDDRLNFGLDHVDMYVQNVDSDWLEHWGKDEPINLGQWLENIFTRGWQRLEEILDIEEKKLPFCFRTAGIKRAKLIDLAIRLDGRDVVLIVTIKPEAEQKLGVLLQVHSISEESYLPEHLKLILLSNDGEVLYEVTARSADNVIQMEFDGEVGEEFSVQVALDDISVTEDFVIGSL